MLRQPLEPVIARFGIIADGVKISAGEVFTKAGIPCFGIIGEPARPGCIGSIIGVTHKPVRIKSDIRLAVAETEGDICPFKPGGTDHHIGGNILNGDQPLAISGDGFRHPAHYRAARWRESASPGHHHKCNAAKHHYH